MRKWPITADISIPLHRLNKLQKTSNRHHSRNCWQFRTLTTPKGCCKASRETEIFLKSESVSQHQPLLLLQFGKTTAFHFDSFHTTTADFKAKVNIQGWLCCLQQINCIAAGVFFGSWLPDRERWTKNSATISGETWHLFQQVFCWLTLLLNPSRYVYYVLHGEMKLDHVTVVRGVYAGHEGEGR